MTSFPAKKNASEFLLKRFCSSRRLPIFTRRFQRTIFGTSELNFCVRNGNRCILLAIITTSSDNVDSNFVLTSTIKEVGQVVQDISNKQLKGEKFNGNTTKTYGLADGGVDVVTDNLSDSIKEALETAKQKIIDGEITVDDGLSD